VNQLPQRVCLNQRHIAIEHQRCPGVHQMRQGLHDRMAGAQLRLLQSPSQIRRVNRRPHCLAAMSIDDTQLPWREAAGGVNHVRNQRLASQRMEYLGQVRMHALALPGGENDDIHELELCQTVRLVFLPLPGAAVSRPGRSGERAETGVVRRPLGAPIVPFHWLIISGSATKNSQQCHA
jgi:hypothetical protein